VLGKFDGVRQQIIQDLAQSTGVSA
jgi:hypothetical protein